MENYKNNIIQAVVELGVCNVLETIRDHFAGVAKVAREMNDSKIGDAYELIAIAVDPENMNIREIAESVGAVQRHEADIDMDKIAEQDAQLAEDATKILSDAITTHLTDNEKKILRGIVESNFSDEGLDSIPWIYAVIDASGLNGLVAGGVISSLLQKGLIAVDQDKPSDASTICLTDDGKTVVASLLHHCRDHPKQTNEDHELPEAIDENHIIGSKNCGCDACEMLNEIEINNQEPGKDIGQGKSQTVFPECSKDFKHPNLFVTEGEKDRAALERAGMPVICGKCHEIKPDAEMLQKDHVDSIFNTTYYICKDCHDLEQENLDKEK